MKKQSILLALALVVCLASSAFALTDIPAGHWAEEYLDTLVATGIILGFPDGTFVGDAGLTRYQAAAITARLMDWVITTGGGSLDMDRVIKELQKHGLSGQQAEEVLIMIRALTLEFRDEIDALDERMDGVDEDLARMRVDILGILSEHYDLEFMVYKLALDVEELEDRVAVLEGKKVDISMPKNPYAFSLKTNFELDYVATNGATSTTDIWKNPFATHVKNTSGVWVPVVWADDYDFRNTVGLGIKVDKDDIKADLDFVGLVYRYGDTGTQPDLTNLSLESITGSVMTNDFTARFGTDFVYMLKPYAFGRIEYRGMVLDSGNSQLVIGTEDDANPNYLAFTQGYDAFNFLQGKLFFVADDVLDYTTREYIVGLENNFSIGIFDLETEVALSDVKDFSTLYTRVAAELYADNFMDFNLRGEYERAGANFVELEDYRYTRKTGFRVDLGIEPLGAEILGWYQNYDNLVDKAGGSFAYEKEIGIFNTELGVTYDQDLDASQLHYHDRLAKIGLDITKFADLSVKYSYADGSVDGLDEYEAAAHHAVIGQLNIKPFQYLTVTANARYNIGGTPAFVHNYKAAAEWSFFSADVAKYFNSENDAIVANAAIEPTFALLGYNVKPFGSFGWHSDVTGKTTGASGSAMKYAAGLGLDRNITESLVWDGEFSWEVKQNGMQGYSGTNENMAGRIYKYGTGFSFKDWANVKAEVGNFEHLSDADKNYEFKVIKGGIKLTF